LQFHNVRSIYVARYLLGIRRYICHLFNFSRYVGFYILNILRNKNQMYEE